MLYLKRKYSDIDFNSSLFYAHFLLAGSVLFYPCYLSRGSLDCVHLINEEHMVSGADNG